MRVLLINGSPRKDGNTSSLLDMVAQKIRDEGIDTETIQLGGRAVHGCTACLKCRGEGKGRCHIKNDIINEIIEKIRDAQGIVIGSPVYFADVTTEVKALIDILGYVSRGEKSILQRKAGAAVIAVRRAGEIHAFNSINHLFLISEMIVPGSSYWNIGIGRDKGDVLNDTEGIKTMETLGENMAWLIKKIN